MLHVQFISTLSKGRNFTIESFDIVAVCGNKVECYFDKVERCFDNVAGVDGALEWRNQANDSVNRPSQRIIRHRSVFTVTMGKCAWSLDPILHCNFLIKRIQISRPFNENKVGITQNVSVQTHGHH